MESAKEQCYAPLQTSPTRQMRRIKWHTRYLKYLFVVTATKLNEPQKEKWMNNNTI